VNVNGILAFAQQVFDFLRVQATALWGVLSAIATNRPEPARTVVIYTIVLAVLLAFAPKIIKKVTK
jgi:hypothetical protein